MAPEQRSDIVDTLEKSRNELIAAVAAVSESQVNVAPAAERWSVLECLEHVTIVEERFLDRLEKAGNTSTRGADQAREAELSSFVRDRTRRAQAPESVRPAGRFTTLAEVLEQFNAVRDRTIRFAQDRAADLYSLNADHPRFGPRNGLEMLLILSGHAQRHAEQIREAAAQIAASPPK